MCFKNLCLQSKHLPTGLFHLIVGTCEPPGGRYCCFFFVYSIYPITTKTNIFSLKYCTTKPSFGSVETLWRLTELIISVEFQVGNSVCVLYFFFMAKKGIGGRLWWHLMWLIYPSPSGSWKQIPL